MKRLTPSRLDAAERFVWHAGRLLERLRFARLFRGGDRDRVLAALRPFQNPDGGFGEALEPDFRGPVSQPETTHMALRIADELDALDDPLVRRVCDWLPTITTAEGGVPNVLASVRGYPHAPWWTPPDGPPPASLLPTAAIVGLLSKNRVEHPWLVGAEAYCWRELATLASVGHPYVVRAALTFLEHAPERARALRAAEALREHASARDMIALDAGVTVEAHGPLDYAPAPDSLARRWFDDAVIERHLDALVDGQQEDGGWTIDWLVWTPAAGLEWRAVQTIQRLRTLRAYGRL